MTKRQNCQYSRLCALMSYSNGRDQGLMVIPQARLLKQQEYKTDYMVALVVSLSFHWNCMLLTYLPYVTLYRTLSCSIWKALLHTHRMCYLIISRCLLAFKQAEGSGAEPGGGGDTGHIPSPLQKKKSTRLYYSLELHDTNYTYLWKVWEDVSKRRYRTYETSYLCHTLLRRR